MNQVQFMLNGDFNYAVTTGKGFKALTVVIFLNPFCMADKKDLPVRQEDKRSEPDFRKKATGRLKLKLRIPNIFSEYRIMFFNLWVNGEALTESKYSIPELSWQIKIATKTGFSTSSSVIDITGRDKKGRYLPFFTSH